MPAIAVDRHRHAAQLDEDVGARRQGGDVASPRLKDTFTIIGVGADPQRPSKVVKDDPGLRKGARQVGEVGNLRVEEPGVEREAGRREAAEALAKSGVEIELRRRIVV